MGEIILAFNSIGKSVFLALVNISLQVTLLILLVWSVIRIFRLRSAATRYHLWFLAVFGVLALPLLGALLPGMNIHIMGNEESIIRSMYMENNAGVDKAVKPANVETNTATVSEEASSKTVEGADFDVAQWERSWINTLRSLTLLDLTSVISLVWFVAASFMLGRLIRSYIWLRHLKRKSQEVEKGQILEIISRLRERMDVTRKIDVFTSSAIHNPTSFGLFSTTIILPESLVDSSGDPPGRPYKELEMVLSHEMAHAKRHDYLVNLFQRVLQSIFFFHPLFRIASRGLTREREHICDDWVIQATGRRDDYAECLVGLVENAIYHPKSISMAMMGHPHNISRRIDMIIDDRRGIITRISRKAGAAILLIGCILLPMLAATRIIYTAEPGAQTTFTNVAKEAGLLEIKRYNSMAVVWGDYDNDGDLDLYVAHSGVAWDWKMEADVFYRNNGDGTFTDATAQAGLEKNKGDARYAGSLDYDNDGYLDLYVYNPTWNGALDNRVLLYRNSGDGTFTDVTQDAGIKSLVGVSTGTGTFADYDNDGDLDMYFIFSRRARIFYENNGDGTFTDGTDRAGLGDEHRGFHTTSGDYDNDGDMDIYLSNGTGEGVRVPAVLYRNNGDGTFTDVAEEAGVNEDRNGRAVVFFDYDNDGDLDLFVVGGPATRLYRNNGDGTFTDVANEAGLLPRALAGLTVGDYDNDGYMDIFAMMWNKPRILYHNNGDGTFTDVAVEAGVSAQATAGGCAFGDYDNDGDLDLYVANLRSPDMLYHNNGNDNNWLHIKLVGTKSNKDGVGARVTVKAGDLSMTREINPCYDRSQPSLTAHFGLGKNAKADSVEIRWPSGPVFKEGVGVIPARVDVLHNIRANQFIVVKEGVGIIESRAVEPQKKLLVTWGKVKSNRLYQNYPNPFNPETWVPFRLAKASDVTIRIYHQSGQLVRTLRLGHKEAGTYLEKSRAGYWDGRNDAGEPVASGVYFYRLEAGNFSQTRKMTVLR